MRLIGDVSTERQAFTFYSFLLERGIHSTYEVGSDQETKKAKVLIWIYEEDEVDRACGYLEAFKQNPQDPQFADVEFPIAPPLPPDHLAEVKKTQEHKPPKQAFIARKRRKYPLTYWTILICAFLFGWNFAQQITAFKQGGVLAIQMGMTPLQQQLMFDYPLANQKINALFAEYSLKSYTKMDQMPPAVKQQFIGAAQTPTWKGVLSLFLSFLKNGHVDPSVQGPLFEKIGQGQIWRLFTPCLLHGNLLHILFNMAWVWILMRQMEERLSKFKLLLFIFIVAIVANVAQYIVSGPYFLGFSAVVVGFVGFIWVRQKKAPWEGYPLQKAAIIFVLVYVVAMFGLEIFSFFRTLYAKEETVFSIANTAHIIGGLCGLALGYVPFFSRGHK